MTTSKTLFEKHGPTPLLEVRLVAAEYFGLTEEKFLRKIHGGEIDLPVTRMEPMSRKAKKFIAVVDLADYIDRRHKEALKERASFRR